MKRAISFFLVSIFSIVLAILFLLMPIVMIEAMFAGAKLFDRLLRWATVEIGGSSNGPFILTLSLLVGVLVFVIREKARFLYAIVEVFFGVYGTSIALTALYASDRFPAIKALVDVNSPYTLYIGLGSGIYIVVRGMENLVKGFMEVSAWTDRVTAKLRKKQVGARAPEETV